MKSFFGWNNSVKITNHEQIIIKKSILLLLYNIHLRSINTIYLCFLSSHTAGVV